jgi:hypothetical protein
MIVRIWRGVTKSADADRYLPYLNQFVMPTYQIANGHEGLLVMEERQGELVQFLLLSFWASDQALASFVGADTSQVNLSPEEKSLLIAFESTARHYKVVYRSESSPVGK